VDLSVYKQQQEDRFREELPDAHNFRWMTATEAAETWKQSDVDPALWPSFEHTNFDSELGELHNVTFYAAPSTPA
jgi:hypothetical protein